MWVPTIFVVILLSTTANGAKILGVFTTPSYSHQIVFQPIWRELSLRGHQVTIYTPSPLNDPTLTNLTEYDLGFSFKYFERLEKAAYDVHKVSELYEKSADAQLSHQYLQDLLKNANNETYDLFLVEYLWQSFYAFKEIYNVPMVGITSLPLTIQGSDALGMEKHPVVDPDMLIQFSYARSFKERVFSWAYNWLYRLHVNAKINPVFNRQIQKYFSNVKKTGYQLTTEVSLVLGNYNFALQNIKPTPPKYVPISAIHVRPQQPLPADLAKVLDNLPNDAIYFSLGTNVKASDLCEKQLGKLLKVLGELPYTILWKYEIDKSSPNVPGNFYVKKWFPQQDLLGHPKVKLFVTQGGMQSIDEALSRKVPMLMIPFLGDQRTNSDRCINLGIAETVDFKTFTEEELTEKITKLLSDPSYRDKIEAQARIAGDQPMSSLDTAVFWIEYVLRHNGAPHLHNPVVDLPFYQYYLLDVYLFVGLIGALFYHVFRKIIAIVLVSMRVLRRLVFTKLIKYKSS